VTPPRTFEISGSDLENVRTLLEETAAILEGASTSIGDVTHLLVRLDAAYNNLHGLAPVAAAAPRSRPWRAP
jgi:hypothetical protein